MGDYQVLDVPERQFSQAGHLFTDTDVSANILCTFSSCCAKKMLSPRGQMYIIIGQ